MPIGKNRLDGIYRLGGLAVLFTIVPTLLTIGVIAGLIWMAVDIVLQLVTNGQGWSRQGGAAGVLKRLYMWPLDMAEWVVFGEGSFPWLP